MLGKAVSPGIMRFSIVFIILFRISFGFHLHFGLDEIFHGLTGGKASLFNFGKYHESKQANQTHDNSFSKDSKKESGSSLEDPLKAIVGTAGAVLNGSVVAGTVGKAEKVLEGTLGTVVGTVKGTETDDLKTVSKIADGTVHGGTLETATRLVSKEASDPLGVIVETEGGPGGGSTSGKAGKAKTSGTLELVTSEAGGVVPALEGSLKTVLRKTGGAASSSVAESSSGVVGKVDKVSGGKVSAGGAVRTIEGALETPPGSTGGAVRSTIVKSFSGSVDEKAGRVKSEKVSLGTVTGNEDEAEYDISEDYLEIIPKNVRETLESRVASVSGGGERGLNEAIQKVPRDISNKSAANSLQTVITDVSVGEACYSKSVVTGFPSFPPVSKFVHIFIQGVEASELLTKLFNITDATSLQLSQFKYRYIADVFRKLGFIDANDIAAATVRHIAKYFDVIFPEVLLRVYANAIANYIFSEGFLTNDNAEQHAQNYIRAMQESAEANGVICECDYNRNFQALGDGVFSFLLSVGEPSHSQAWGTAFYYAHEWLLAAVDYGSLRDLAVKK